MHKLPQNQARIGQVRIFQPAKTAMQSGRCKANTWILEFAPQTPVTRDQLIGWVGSADTAKQIRLVFDSKDEALAYAHQHGLAYTLHNPRVRTVRPKSYSANFAHDRRQPWTH